MKKSEVKTHSSGIYAPYYPAINVKCYHWVTLGEIMNRFKCSEAQAKRASEYAYNASVHRFWEEAQELAKEVLGDVKVYSAGRSGGWLIVDGLEEVKWWDAIKLGKWAKFVKSIKSEIDYLSKTDKIFEDIDANEWYKEGAEEFNFFDTKSGETKCIADLKAQAIVAGYAAVVRP